LNYLGSVVAAPSANMAPVAPAMFLVPERGYGVLFLAGASTVEPRLDPAVSLGAGAATRQALLTHGCWEEAVPGFEDIPSEEMLAGPEVAELLGSVLLEYASYDPARITGPLLVVHGEEDLSLPIELTEEVVADLCAAGVAVDFRRYPGSGHDEVLAASSGDSAEWIAARVAGEQPASTCNSGT
jgi:pimeloyl-ACP methyl ester carboxylesterase